MGWNYHMVYIIPAFLGALALMVIAVEVTKTFGTSKG
jgi:hypothetical protein